MELFTDTSIINEFEKSINQDQQKTAENREAAIDALDEVRSLQQHNESSKELDMIH